MNARELWGALANALVQHDTPDGVMKSLEHHGFAIMSKEDVEAVRDKALEEAATKLDDGSYTMLVSEPWRDDGQPSKHDKCKHGATMYEDCIECAAAAIRSLKSGGRAGKEARE